MCSLRNMETTKSDGRRDREPKEIENQNRLKTIKLENKPWKAASVKEQNRTGK